MKIINWEDLNGNGDGDGVTFDLQTGTGMEGALINGDGDGEGSPRLEPAPLTSLGGGVIRVGKTRPKPTRHDNLLMYLNRKLT